MIPKPVSNPNYDIQKINEKFDSTISKIYTFLAIGWIVEIVGFSAEKINYSGTQFTLTNQHAFPGVIYIVCLFFYAKIIFLVVYYGISIGFTNRHIIKRAVRYAWVKSVTGRKTSDPIRFRKLYARFIMGFWGIIMLIGVFFPLLYIAVFKHEAVLQALHGASA